MGLLFDWFLKNSESKQIALDYPKLNRLFVSQNGLYRNHDGSIPSLEDFAAHGFSEDEFFLAVYGKTQESIQERLMQRNATKRGNRRKMINSRLVKNTKLLQDSVRGNKKAKTKRNLKVNEFALFAPFGLYSLGVQDGQFSNIIDQSVQLTGSAFGLFEMVGMSDHLDNHAIDNPMDDLMSAMNQNYVDNEVHDVYGFNDSFNSSNDIF